MIRATLERDASGRYLGLAMEGHSDYAPAGYDIVCAAVSVLGTNCVNSLEALSGIKVILQANGDGILRFRLPALSESAQLHDAQLLMGALHQGLKDVADQYPNELELFIRERRETL